MTPYELSICVKEYQERINDQLHLAYIQSLWTSRFVWSKKVPKFEELIKNQDKEELTDEELFNKVKALNRQMGGVTDGGS